MAQRSLSPQQISRSPLISNSPSNTRVSEARLSDLKNVMLNTIEYILNCCDELWMVAQSVRTVEQLVANKKKLVLAVNMKKVYSSSLRFQI